MELSILYCYDAWCGWCYGFSSVMQSLFDEYRDVLFFEVLSGGMILPETPKPVSATASYIKDEYKKVEELTGVRFGQDYLWHIFNPDKSDWFPDSMKPAIALCIFKEHFPDEQVVFASDLQQSLHLEGRDLCDDEAYRHLIEKYQLSPDDFYYKLHSPEYREKALYEFTVVKQLKVTGLPTVLMQTGDTRFYLLSRGYTPLDTMKERVELVRRDLASS